MRLVLAGLVAAAVFGTTGCVTWAAADVIVVTRSDTELFDPSHVSGASVFERGGALELEVLVTFEDGDVCAVTSEGGAGGRELGMSARPVAVTLEPLDSARAFRLAGERGLLAPEEVPRAQLPARAVLVSVSRGHGAWAVTWQEGGEVRRFAIGPRAAGVPSRDPGSVVAFALLAPFTVALDVALSPLELIAFGAAWLFFRGINLGPVR